MSPFGSVATAAMWLLFSVSCRSQTAPVGSHPDKVESAPLAASGTGAGAAGELENGVTVRELELDRDGARIAVWIYDPPPAANGPRPVILIAAAGSPLIWGMNLDVADRPEHVPWAKRGYVVVAYAVDGHVESADHDASVVAGVRAFVRANAGLDSARAALEHALANAPRADPERIYAVGHSSAGTLALRVGAELPRIKAIVAFNPVTDVERSIGQDLQTVGAIEPRALACLRASSPMSHIAALRRKPVFLFHSAVDTGVPVTETTRLVEALKPFVEPSKVLIVPTGDHYDSMIAQGIPAAIDWLDAVSSSPSTVPSAR